MIGAGVGCCGGWRGLGVLAALATGMKIRMSNEEKENVKWFGTTYEELVPLVMVKNVEKRRYCGRFR